MSRSNLIDNRTHCKDLQSQTSMVQSLDINGKILDVSPKWLEKTGFSRDEIVSHFFSDFFEESNKNVIAENFEHLKNYGFIDNVLVFLKRKGAVPIEVVLNGTSIYDQQGQFINTVCELRTLEYYMHSVKATEELLEKERFLSMTNALRANISTLLTGAYDKRQFLEKVEECLSEPVEIESIQCFEMLSDTSFERSPIDISFDDQVPYRGHSHPAHKNQNLIVKLRCTDIPDAVYKYNISLHATPSLFPLWMEALKDIFLLIHSGLVDIDNRLNLEKTSRQLESLVNNVDAIGLEIDLDLHRFTYVSPRLQPILGYKTIEWNDLDQWLSLIHPEDRAKLQAAFNPTTGQTQSEKFEFRIEDKFGNYQWLLAHIRYDDHAVKPNKLFGVLIDISSQKQVQESLTKTINQANALTREQQSLLSLFDMGDVVLFKWKNDANWSVDYASLSVERLLGFSPEDFTLHGKLYGNCVHPHDLPRVLSEVQEAMRSRQTFFKHQPYRIVTKHNQVKWVADITYIVRDADQNITHFVGYVYDISIEQEAHQQLQSIIDLQENIVIVTDGKRIMFANQKFNEFFGITRLEDFLKEHRCICKFFIDEKHHYFRKDNDEDWLKEIQTLPEEKRIVRMNKEGSGQASFLVKQAQFSDTSFVVTFSDITETLKEKNFYQYLAQHDRLTGCFNREYLYHKFDKFHAATRRNNKRLALVLFDIDHFKKVNDTYGHNVGDDVLKHLANIVREIIRIHDTLVRWGGEEFILLAEVDSIESAGAMAEHLRYKIEQSRFPASQTITSSFGVSLVRDEEPMKSSISRADQALYIAKSHGRNQVQLESKDKS